MHDIVVLGGGPGGYASALYAHNFGLDVALVVNERPGGTCLHRGCIPAKQWLQVAEVYSTVRHASDFGVVTSAPDLDWQAALRRRSGTRPRGAAQEAQRHDRQRPRPPRRAQRGGGLRRRG